MFPTAEPETTLVELEIAAAEPEAAVAVPETVAANPETTVVEPESITAGIRQEHKATRNFKVEGRTWPGTRRVLHEHDNA